MIRLDRFLAVYFCEPWLKWIRKDSEKRIPILMYHSISDELEEKMPEYYRVNTRPKKFLQHMEWLHYQNYSIIDVDEALRRVQNSTLIPDRCVVLTFDDGFRDFFVNAWPVLKYFRYRATVYLPTAFIGESRKVFKGRECLTWKEVRELHRQGISLGSHTVNHPTLYGLPWEEIGRELGESRQRIEKELQAPISLFCYPYAFPQEDAGFVRRLRRELVGQGYRNSVTTIIGRVRGKDDPFCMPRLPINESDDVELFEAKLTGAYDWMAHAQSFIRHVKLCMRRTRRFVA